MGFFLSWTRGLHEHGLGEFFAKTPFCDYPPVWLLCMWAIGHIGAIFDHSLKNEILMQALLKAPSCIADVAIALLLYFEGRRWVGHGRAAAAAGLFFLNPLSLYNSAYWGQVDSIHTALCLASLVMVTRNRLGLAGALASVALLQKFQTIAIIPIILLEIFRRSRFKGIGLTLIGAIAAAAVVAAPFGVYGVLGDVLQRSYVNVVGQYTDLSRSAYNVWWLTGDPDVADTAIPNDLARFVGQGQLSFPDNASWLLGLSWRRISLLVYSIVVAVILSLYALKPSTLNRFGCAGILCLAFFLFPTEMHERYAWPVIAFLPLWAVAGAWRERVFFLLSALLLLNVADFLPAKAISSPIAAANIAIFVALVGWVILGPRGASVEESPPLSVPGEPLTRPSIIIGGFQILTALSVVAAIGAGGWLYVLAESAPPLALDENCYYLSEQTPKLATQGWKELQVDRSVGGGALHLGSTIYMKGLGTHAKSALAYAVPNDVSRFEAVVGINHVTGDKGSVVASVEVDGKTLWKSETLTGTSEPVPVSVDIPFGAKLMTLRAGPIEDNKADHVDWALARFIMNTKERTEPAPNLSQGIPTR